MDTAGMGATETRRIADYPLFDWLRIAMAGLVAAYHLGLVRWRESGNLGVQVFFALSGWLIGGILIAMPRDRLSLFYFNRATRVWLPYFAAMAVLYFASIVHRDPVDARWFEFLFYDVTFTHNFFALLPDVATASAQMPLGGSGNHFWSLAVEEQFYLAAPLICLFTRAGKHPLTWAAIGLAMLFVREEFAAISFGVAAAALHHRAPGFQLRPAVIAMAVAVLAISAPLLYVLGPAIYYFAAPFFSIAVVLLLARPGPRGAIGQYLGAISFPLYLNHWIAADFLHSVTKRWHIVSPLTGYVGLVLALAIAAIAYALVDRPVLARRQAWYTPARGRALAILAYAVVTTGIVGGLWMRVL